MMMKPQTKILFVCLGNICRSPSAHGIMEHILFENNMQDKISVDSAGTIAAHQGELPDSRMRAHARKRGYDLTHRSRKITSRDFEEFDYIIGMDDYNISNLKAMAPDIESEHKICRMTDFSINPTLDHVPDPYYSGADGFELVLDLLEDACQGLLNELKNK